MLLGIKKQLHENCVSFHSIYLKFIIIIFFREQVGRGEDTVEGNNQTQELTHLETYPEPLPSDTMVSSYCGSVCSDQGCGMASARGPIAAPAAATLDEVCPVATALAAGYPAAAAPAATRSLVPIQPVAAPAMDLLLAMPYCTLAPSPSTSVQNQKLLLFKAPGHRLLGDTTQISHNGCVSSF